MPHAPDPVHDNDCRSTVRERMSSGEFDLDRISSLEQRVGHLTGRIESNEKYIVELERALEDYLGTGIFGIRKPLWAKERERILGRK